MEPRGSLADRRILLGVTGSIAAYKAVELLRKLRERGASVRVVMTRHAAEFVAPLTFGTLSSQPVLIDEFALNRGGAIGHIDVTDGLDAALIAPATANIIGKLAAGIADDALSSAVMALGRPLVIAPAMNTRMYRNPVLQRNIETLRAMGVRFVEPGTGSLACGTEGQGRLAETDSILRELETLFLPRDLAGRRVLVTAGPTREAIDAVRFISNPSTGKMGYALAAAAQERGAEVVLVSGPVQLAPPHGVTVVPVVSAADMRAAVLGHFPKSDIVVMAAAVSDFRPSTAALRKIKKDEAADVLQLERTDDILAELGKKGGPQLLFGFAAETDDLESNALAKLKAKNLDLIAVNDVLRRDAGFGSDTNAVICFDRSGNRREFPSLPKIDLARALIGLLIDFMNRKSG